MSEQVYVERQGAIATVVLNQPERRNAMNSGMARRIQEIMEACDADLDLRCVVLRGAGGKAFSAGADISEFEQVRSTKERARDYAKIMMASWKSVSNCRHPTIALIEGMCVGGGLGVASLCDFRVCGQSSRFGVPVKRLGLVEAPDELEPLVKKFGANTALEILLIGDVFGTDDALRMGLVNRVVPDGQVVEAAYEMAAKIAEGAPLVARWHKKFVYRHLDPTPISAAEQEEGYDCFDTEDFQIGYKAFLAKTKPEFVGR